MGRMVKTARQHVALPMTGHRKEMTQQGNLAKNLLPFFKREGEMEAPKVICLRLLLLISEQRTEYFILSTTLFSRRTLYHHHHQLNVPVVHLVEIVRENVQKMTDVASRRLDGANETVRKGSVGIMEHSVQVEAAMMALQLKSALVVSIVPHVRKR